MPLDIHETSQFKKDVKKLKRQGKDLSELLFVIKIMVQEDTLPVKYRDHNLIGSWRGHRECHIKPDWLLVYKVSDGILYLERTGSHAELFG